MKLRYIPNILTLLRFLLVIPVLSFLLKERYTPAFYFFLLAGVTDALDGLLARFFNWTSRFGAIADPLADKLLLTTSFIALGWVQQIPMWLVVIVVARDLWILMGGIAYRVAIGQINSSPSHISKINTFLQILLVVLTLVNLSFFTLPTVLLDIVLYSVLITTVISMMHYTWIWGWRAYTLKSSLSSNI